MFPELFSNLRTQPAIFNQIPSTQTETVMNEDGSTVTRTMSSKAFRFLSFFLFEKPISGS
jgi:hypothetical protein